MALNIEREVAAMRRMATGTLRAKYSEAFGEQSRSRSKGSGANLDRPALQRLLLSTPAPRIVRGGRQTRHMHVDKIPESILLLRPRLPRQLASPYISHVCINGLTSPHELHSFLALAPSLSGVEKWRRIGERQG